MNLIQPVFTEKFLEPIDKYLSPKFTLEPIQVINLTNQRILDIESHGGQIQHYYWKSARSALRSIFEFGNPQRSSKVKVCTSSQSDYLSSCINQTFEVGVSREKEDHEIWDIFAADFGYQNEVLSSDTRIYDDAWSFSMELANEFLNSEEKYYVTSLPKVIGSSYGALVLTRNSKFFSDKSLSQSEIVKVSKLSNKLFSEWEITSKIRFSNLEILGDLLGKDFSIFFANFKTNYPGAGVFKYYKPFNEREFKVRLQEKGVRGTSFFGNNAVILPIHQLLSENDLRYIAEITKHCIKFC